MCLLRFGGEDARCLNTRLESKEGSAWPFTQPRDPLAKKFVTKTSASPSYRQFGTSSCEQSICLFLLLLSSVFRPRHWAKGELNYKLSLYFSTCGQYLGYQKKPQVSSLVSCFGGHVEQIPAVEGSSYEYLKMKTSLGKDTT